MKIKKRLYSDYRKIKIELLKALRKDLSQQEMSQKLGLSFNQFGKWETHQKQLKWSEFVRITELCRLSTTKPLQGLNILFNNEKPLTKKLLKNIIMRQGIDNLKEMAKELQTSTKTLQRWLDGSGEPELELILQLLDLNPGFLAFFCTTVLEGKVIPSVSDEVKYYSEIDAAVCKEPNLPIILGALQLKEYLKNSSYATLSKLTNLSKTEILKVLKLGEKLGLIRKIAKEQYKSIDILSQLLFASTDDIHRLLRSYANIPSGRIQIEKGHFKNTTAIPNSFYARLNVLTENQALKIHSILINAIGEIDQICKTQEPDTELATLRLIHFNYFDVRDA